MTDKKKISDIENRIQSAQKRLKSNFLRASEIVEDEASHRVHGLIRKVNFELFMCQQGLENRKNQINQLMHRDCLIFDKHKAPPLSHKQYALFFIGIAGIGMVALRNGNREVKQTNRVLRPQKPRRRIIQEFIQKAALEISSEIARDFVARKIANIQEESGGSDGT